MQMTEEVVEVKLVRKLWDCHCSVHVKFDDYLKKDQTG